MIIRQVKLNTKYYQNCETALMKYLKGTCGLTAFSDQVIVITIVIIIVGIVIIILFQEILNALGLFEMFGVGLQNGLSFLMLLIITLMLIIPGARAIFPTLLSLQHKCSPNT